MAAKLTAAATGPRRIATVLSIVAGGLVVPLASTAAAAATSPTGSISGIVEDAGGHGIPNITVCVMTAPREPCASFVGTGADGSYTVSGLAPGRYLVTINGNPGDTNFGGTYYLGPFFYGGTSESDATPVTVNAGATTPDIDATLGPAGAISGLISNTNGDGIAKMDVSAVSGSTHGYAMAGDSGGYVLGGLPAGSYTVYFNHGPSGTGPGNVGKYYLGPSYYGGTSEADAVPVVVTLGATTPSINATLTSAGAVSGSVKDETGAGIADIKVNVRERNADHGSGFTFTDQSGNYLVGGLPAGSGYVVSFNDLAQRPNPYHLDQFYNAKTTEDAADAVTVTINETRSGVDATLATYGHISGKVTEAAGGFGARAMIAAYRSAKDFRAGNPVAATVTYADDGAYDLYGLPAGNYIVVFCDRPMPGYPTYLTQFSGNATKVNKATPVPVVKGKTTASVNAALTNTSTDGTETATGAILLPTYDSDVLPGLTEAGQTQTATANVTVKAKNGKVDASSSVSFAYQVGGHSISVESTSVAWTAIHGSWADGFNSQSTATIQATARVVIDGATTVNPIRVTLVDGDLLLPAGSDAFALEVYAAGANPSADAPLYHVNGLLTGGAVTITR